MHVPQKQCPHSVIRPIDIFSSKHIGHLNFESFKTRVVTLKICGHILFKNFIFVCV